MVPEEKYVENPSIGDAHLLIFNAVKNYLTSGQLQSIENSLKGIIDSTEMETRQSFSLKPLLELESLLLLDMCLSYHRAVQKMSDIFILDPCLAPVKKCGYTF